MLLENTLPKELAHLSKDLAVPTDTGAPHMRAGSSYCPVDTGSCQASLAEQRSGLRSRTMMTPEHE